MRKQGELILGVVLAAIVIAGAFAFDHLNRAELKPVTLAPTQGNIVVNDFSFTILQGKKMSLNDLRGKGVIINFWATWCPPCVAEFPMLVDITEKYPGKIVIVALSSDKKRDDVERFVARLEKQIGHGLNPERVMIAIDEGRVITRDQFKISTYPESIIVAPNGSVAEHIAGIEGWGSAEVQQLLADIAARAE